ncbi:MAG: hypothetical protein M1828_000265 [Chrysothrix sp. TS-e1954]|nr:MAG: hypothetical protein M1828_000265 [Chrysothrix sp. TS-e1954]
MSANALPPLPLPKGVTSRYVDCTKSVGLNFHILESGSAQDPLLLLIHGFPELAFSWRKVLPALVDPWRSARQYHVVAVDQRGYGRTTWSDDRDFASANLRTFTFLQLVADMLALVRALGHDDVGCIVGHDFGSVTASTCALVRPDVFRSCVMMSHPFKGIPDLIREGEVKGKDDRPHDPDVHASLAQLDPPRKHYKWANSTPEAAEQWLHPPQGLHDFLRGYLHLKSADWAGNDPCSLKGWTALELARMPYYYIMPLHLSMGETVAEGMKGEDPSTTERWMSERDLNTYVAEWTRTGFQGGLNWYRSGSSKTNNAEMLAFAGKKIECPCIFISGAKDWGNFQEPGALEDYEKKCGDFRGRVFLDGAGHWPQQETPEKVVMAIRGFLEGLR